MLCVHSYLLLIILTFPTINTNDYISPPPNFLAILPFINSFVSNHLHTVAFTHAASFPLKLSPGLPVIHFSNALSVNVLITVWTIICCRNANENCCISPNPAADAINGSSLPEAAKLVSEEVKEDKSSDVKFFDSSALVESDRDQNGMIVLQ